MKLQNRSFGIALAILLVFSIACTRIPLLNYLGFEFSVLTVLFAGFICGLLVLSLWRRTGCKCKADVWRFIGDVSFVQFILLIIPFLISLVNVLFVKNCSIGNGIVLYILVVIPGVAFSTALAIMIGIIFKKWNKTIFTVSYILVLLHIFLITILHPQIFAFNPIIGFFPGFTYDETLQVTQRLLTYRIATLAASGCLVIIAVWIWQVRFNKKEQENIFQQSFSIPQALFRAFLQIWKRSHQQDHFPA